MRYSIHSNNRALQVDLVGDFTFNDSDLFQNILRAMRPCNDALPMQIRLNMDQVTTMDCSALELLILANEVAHQRHQELYIENAHGDVGKKIEQASIYHNSMQVVA